MVKKYIIKDLKSHKEKDCTFLCHQKSQEDQELINAISSKPEAIICLFNKYQDPILRYILRISHFSYETAEEISQNSWIKIWKALIDKNFDSQKKFRPWMYKIVHNETISTWRSQKNKEAREVSLNDDKDLELIPLRIDILKEIEKKLTAEKVHQVLQKMSFSQRSALILYFLHDKKYSDIGSVLEISLSAVNSLLHRAKKKFMQIAKEDHIQFY